MERTSVTSPLRRFMGFLCLALVASAPSLAQAEPTLYLQVPSETPEGRHYAHEGAPGAYRLEIYSPEGLPDMEYSPD